MNKNNQEMALLAFVSGEELPEEIEHPDIEDEEPSTVRSTVKMSDWYIPRDIIYSTQWDVHNNNMCTTTSPGGEIYYTSRMYPIGYNVFSDALSTGWEPEREVRSVNGDIRWV